LREGKTDAGFELVGIGTSQHSERIDGDMSKYLHLSFGHFSPKDNPRMEIDATGQRGLTGSWMMSKKT